MDFDWDPYFQEYAALAALADATFERVRSAYPDNVRCGETCDDCCYALFDLSLVEAIHLHHHFQRHGDAETREAILAKANVADREIYRLKRNAYKAVQGGRSEDMVLADMAAERVRCPLLNDQRRCDLYENRPLTCRFYGVPTAIGGQGHTCGLSAFKAGEKYPTVNLDAIHTKLADLSMRLARDLKSPFAGLGEMLVPVSMALLTEYDARYLGLESESNEAPESSGNQETSPND